MPTRKIIPVPFEVAGDMTLSWQQKFVMAEILYLHKKDGCYAKQKHFCNILNIKSDVCSRIFKKLIKDGFIERVNDRFIPLKFVDQKSSQKLTKSQHDQKSKVDQKSSEVDQKSSEHHIIQDDKLEEDSPISENGNNGNDFKGDKEPSISDFGDGRKVHFKLWDLFKELDNAHKGTPTNSQIYDLKEICRSIEQHLRDLKKEEGFTNFPVHHNEILEHFKDFHSKLSEKDLEKFTTKHIRWNYSDLRYKQDKKPTKPEKVKPKIYQMKKRKR